jgi:hypothetical protein
MLTELTDRSIELNPSQIVKPIFILGSGRSGTSVLSAALRTGARIQGYPEGHFLPLIHYLVKEIDRFYQIKKHLIDEEYALGHVNIDRVKQEVIKSIRIIADGLYASSQWVDKSPGYETIEAAPYLLQAWENARFIFAKRRGIECLISRLKKFPHVSFENHCTIWAKCMQSWLEIRDRLPQDCAIEIDQRDIALSPKLTAAKIGNFLNLEAEKIAKIEDIFTNKRPQSTGSQESEVAIDLEATGWNPEEIAIFRKICGNINQAFGYSEDNFYYINRQ